MIPVGRDEKHTLIVETSLARGLKSYTVDASGTRTPIQRGACRIMVGEREEHQVEVKLDVSHRVNVLVDGKLVEQDLFPRMRETIIAVVIGFLVIITLTVTIAVVLLTKLLAF